MNSVPDSPTCSPASAESAGRLTLAAWVIISLLGVAVLLGNAPAPRRVLLVLAFLGCVVECLRAGTLRRYLPYFLPWAGIALLSAAWSPLPETTAVDALGEAIFPIAGGLLAMTLAMRVAGRHVLLPFAMLAAFSLPVLAGALHQHAGWWPAAPSWLTAAYPGRGVASTLGVLLSLAGGGLLAGARQRRGVPVLAAALVVCGLLLGVLGYNRMYWLALIVGLLPWLNRFRDLPRRLRPALIAGLAALLLAGIVYSTLHPKVPLPPGVPAPAASSYAEDPRWQIWQRWLAVAADRPLLGYGYGSRILPRVGEQQIPGGYGDLDWVAQHHAHNVLINLVVQTGLLGLLCFLWMLYGLWRIIFAASPPGVPPGPWQLAALSVVLAALAKSLTDDFFWGPAGILMWLLAGLFAGLARRRDSGERQA